MMDKWFFLSLSVVFLLAGLFGCSSSAPSDEIIPLYEGFEEYAPDEFPLEESTQVETESPVPSDDLSLETLVPEPLFEEQLSEESLAEEQLSEELEPEASLAQEPSAFEPLAGEPLPEIVESGEPASETAIEEDRETLEALRETVEALRDTVEALREALEALRVTQAPEPAPPEPQPPAPTPPPETPTPVQPTPEPPPPEPPLPEPPSPEPPSPEPPSPEPQPPATPIPAAPPPSPPPEMPTPEQGEPETLPPEPPPETPPPPPPPPEPPPFLGPAEPLNPLPVIEPLVPALLPELPDRTLPETPEEQIAFSRIVRVTVGQVLEIPYRGTGWVYLGELGNRRGINYESRRLDFQSGSRSGQETVEGQSFVFSVERVGTYILRFYRQDFIQDYIINDYVQVIAGERDDNTWRSGDRVIAEPRWPPVADTVTQTPVTEPAERPAQSPVTQVTPPVGMTEPEAPPSTTVPDNTPSTVAPPTSPPQVPVIESPAEYVRRARTEFDAGRIEPALGILDTMRQNYPGGTDEAWWLYGQLLEANSSSRDVRLALEYYRRLVNEFPFSDLVDEARRRIAYLERFYFNIR